ncbi:hypothetical protein MKEN_01029500 [Mycena kentingensis (nom. inval.)]|nr:hypothetical protein MKEN_01029500 [Mycena kentingensis (nom. inval.)]
MASRKKQKTLPGLQQTFDGIKGAFILNHPPSLTPTRKQTSCCDSLRGLAEAFTEQRQAGKSKARDWTELADELDQEGVNLWNISGLVQKAQVGGGGGDKGAGSGVVGALRLAAFRLIEAGQESELGIESQIHMLQLASKTGATLSEAGDGALAGTVLASAARYEDTLRKSPDADGAHRVARICATLVYFAARMEAAWQEGNEGVADFMARKITEDEDKLKVLPPADQDRLACKFHEIGKALLKTHSELTAAGTGSGASATEAVAWLQKAFAIADRISGVDGEPEAAGRATLKISVLRTMARAYFVTGAYDRAEAALDELIPTIDALAAGENGRSEYQELRWLRLAVLKRRKAGDTAILDGFKSIVEHMTFCESNITDILQDLRTFPHRSQHMLVTNVQQHCLQQLLAAPSQDETTSEATNRVVLSLIVHCSKDEDQQRAVQVINQAFSAAHEAEFKFLGLPATACLTLLWQYGDRHFSAKRFPLAAEWYLLGTHALFHAAAPTTAAKCFRKAALCYLEQKEFARAAAVIRRCPTGVGQGEAATQYVLFVAAVNQGLDDEGKQLDFPCIRPLNTTLAIRAIRSMSKAADFDRKMLLLATQISHESGPGMRTVLVVVLEALLGTLKSSGVGGQPGETLVEGMTLVRCILRLVLKLLLEPGANLPVLIDTLIRHFHTAKSITEDAAKQKSTALISKDISWLWRTAYNCAVQGCSEWEQSEERVAVLFEVARDLLTISCDASPIEVSAETYVHLTNATFSAVTARIFNARRVVVAGNADLTRTRSIAVQITQAKQSILSITTRNAVHSPDDQTRLEYFLHVLRVFEAEMFAQLKEWEALAGVVSDVVAAGPVAVGTYEAIADILWAEPECPTAVLLTALEAILRASLEHTSLSIEKFSRWLRAICTILLARNAGGDRVRAIGYVEQAVSVIEEHSGAAGQGDDVYPIDERNWLLGTAYNTGFECLEASILDEAKRWFETATLLCKFVRGGEERAAQISETYTHLLARYNPA